MARRNEPVPESEVDNLVVMVVSRTRNHPEVVRGASVRGAIAFKEVLQGFQEIEGKITRGSIEKAALVTLPPRIATKPGHYAAAVAVVSEILGEILYGIPLPRVRTASRPPDKTGGLSPEDIVALLQNLTSAQLSPEPNIGSASRERVVIVPDEIHRQERSRYPASRDFRQEGKGDWYSSAEKALRRLLEELEHQLARGEITEEKYYREKSKLEEMLGAARQLRHQMSREELAQTVLELMDAKDKQWQKELDFQDMYVYYHIKGTCEGKQLSPPKRSWYGLRAVVDYLEKEGIVEPVTEGKSFTLTAEAMDTLLEHLIAKAGRGEEARGITEPGHAALGERKQEIRRYTIGDVYRDISVRHTLREIARQKKRLADIDRRHLRVFLKQRPRWQSDIVLCLDSSGSMGFRQKLIYARLVAAGLARAALERGERVGLVTFENFGRTILPLTRQREEILGYLANINAGGNTNIGDGIKCATELLRREPGHNQKYIVLITDGQPTAITGKAFARMKPTKEKDLSEESAVLETGRASSSGVRVSVVHVTQGKEAGEEFVQNMAKVGRGQVRRVSSWEDLKAILRREVKSPALLG